MREWVKFTLLNFVCLLFENVIPDPKQFAKFTNKFQSEHVKTWDSTKDEQKEVEHRVKRI